MKAAQPKQNYEQLQKLTRTVSPSVARRKHPQSYPRKSNKAHTADLSRFVGEKKHKHGVRMDSKACAFLCKKVLTVNNIYCILLIVAAIFRRKKNDQCN